jgi:hypothetical protein
MAVLLILSALFLGLKYSHNPIMATAAETVKAMICPSERSPGPVGTVAGCDSPDAALAFPVINGSVSNVKTMTSIASRLFMSEPLLPIRGFARKRVLVKVS